MSGSHQYLLTSPYEGLRPTTPQYEAGSRTEPPVSVPKALNINVQSLKHCEIRSTYAVHIPAATAAALPPELPPADLSSTEPLG